MQRRSSPSFSCPNDPTTPAATDFVSIRRTTSAMAGPFLSKAYDANGQLLATTSAVDLNGPMLSLAMPGIHSIRILGTSTTAFDDLTFAQLYAAPAYRYDVKAIDPDHDALTYSLTTAPPGMLIDAATGVDHVVPAGDARLLSSHRARRGRSWRLRHAVLQRRGRPGRHGADSGRRVRRPRWQRQSRSPGAGTPWPVDLSRPEPQRHPRRGRALPRRPTPTAIIPSST